MKQVKNSILDKMLQDNTSSAKKVSNKPKLSASEAKTLLFLAMSNASHPATEGIEISEMFEEVLIRTNDNETNCLSLSYTASVLFVLVYTITKKYELAFGITKIYLSSYEIFDLEICSKYFEFYKSLFNQEEN